MDPKTYSQVVIVMMIGAIFGGIAFGLASDRLGRRAMMVAAFLGALAVAPLWAFSSGMAAILAGAFLMQFMVQGAWGIIPAHISELSPDRVRGLPARFRLPVRQPDRRLDRLGPGLVGRAIRLSLRDGHQRRRDFRLRDPHHRRRPRARATFGVVAKGEGEDR